LEEVTPPPKYGPDVKLVLKDGYPLYTREVPNPPSDRLPLAHQLALNAEADLSTCLAIKSHSTIRLAYAKLAAARTEVDFERSLLLQHVDRRKRAWKALLSTLGEHALRTPSPPPSPAFPLWTSGRKGKGKRRASQLDDSDVEPEDARNLSGSEDMPE
jgi:hypothetical protein